MNVLDECGQEVHLTDAGDYLSRSELRHIAGRLGLLASDADAVEWFLTYVDEGSDAFPYSPESAHEKAEKVARVLSELSERFYEIAGKCDL